MSFKSAIEKIMGKITKEQKIDDNIKKYKNILNQLIERAEWVHSTATKSSLPCLYIYVTPSANIDTIKEIYEDLNIKTKKHVSHLDNSERTVLYIETPEFMNLTKQQQEILEAPTKPSYKRQIQLSAKETIIR